MRRRRARSTSLLKFPKFFPKKIRGCSWRSWSARTTSRFDLDAISEDYDEGSSGQ